MADSSNTNVMRSTIQNTTNKEVKPKFREIRQPNKVAVFELEITGVCACMCASFCVKVCNF